MIQNFEERSLSRRPASAATASDRRGPGVAASVPRETRTGTLTRNYRVLLSLSIALKPALNVGGI